MKTSNAKQIKRLKLWSPKAFLFLPWPLFWNQHADVLIDSAKLRIGFSDSADCSKINETFWTLVAHTEGVKRKGLSGRHDALKANESMLFIYNEAERLSFWMKETYIPLQIAFFDSQGLLIETLEMPVEKNPKNPVHYYTSSRPSTTAVEMNPKTLDSKQKLTLCVEKLL
jgi:uncharacterized membrane protein (UPF0127 family)